MASRGTGRSRSLFSEVPDFFTTRNSIVCVRMNSFSCRPRLCGIARPVCEPKAHPSHRWTVRQARTPFPPAGPALGENHAYLVRDCDHKDPGLLRHCTLWRRHEKPLRSSSLGRGPKVGPDSLPSEGPSASSARVDARRGRAVVADAWSVSLFAVHSAAQFHLSEARSLAQGTRLLRLSNPGVKRGSCVFSRGDRR